MWFILLFTQKFTDNINHKILEPQNTHDQIFWTYEIPKRKIFGHTKTR